MHDLNLSRALGGLRIANPDDAVSSPIEGPSGTENATADRDASPQYEQQTQLDRSELTEPPSNISYDNPGQPPFLPAPAQAPGSSLPLPHASSTSRPTSSLYTAAERDQAANSYNLLRTEPAKVPVRTDSRSNAAYAAGSAGIPTRESSHRDRAYNQSRSAALPTGNGALPPRKSSKGMGGGYASIPGIPVVPEPSSGFRPEGPMSQSSEEWKDKGAALSMRKEVDASGKTVMRPVKKGVRDFAFGRVLGEGSYSTVYLATDRQTLKEYAVKVLEKRHIIKEKKIKYVNIEKDTLNRLTEHPGIVRLYYTFQDEASLYYVLDLCVGGELLGVLKKTGTFDEECTRFYGAEILDAIEYMHSRGVIHRDLKPENVLLDEQMHVKITDFGTARLLTDPRNPQGSRGDGRNGKSDESDDNRSPSFVGTAEYVSPELLTNKNACKASDLWAFGCIIYQLLAGRPPFKAPTEYATFQKIVALDYEFPAGFPPAARDLVERCLVLDPARRLTIEHIKNHQFFEGSAWGKGLWRMKAPRLRPYVPPTQEPKIIQLNGASTASPQTPSANRLAPAVPSSNGGARTPGRIITDIPPPSQLDIEWSPVLTRNNERILRLGDLMVLSSSIPNSPHSKNGNGSEGPGKLSRLFGGNTTKKRQRLVMVTSSGRIVLAPAGGEEKKAKQEISLLASDCSWKVQVDAKGQTVWCVDSGGMHYTFEESKTGNSLDSGRPSAEDWIECLEQAKEMAYSQSASNSYASEGGFGDMSSSMSSPSSTFGGNAGYPDGFSISDRSHRHHHLSKSQLSLDEPSTTKRNRFSKRQSKQGLGPAF